MVEDFARNFQKLKICSCQKLKGNDAAKFEADSKVNTYTTSQAFGHYSFFTDGPCLQDYWTGSLARIMILSKAQINELVGNLHSFLWSYGVPDSNVLRQSRMYFT
eukprot:881846-Pelagomonas_calceolata.AAC.1